jgi:toxin HigB-1
MIVSWKHKGLKQFYQTGSKAGIQPEHAKRLTIILQLLDAAESPELLNLPGFYFHGLRGDLKGFYSVRVNGNWRVIFQFEGKNATLVDYLDYLDYH